MDMDFTAAGRDFSLGLPIVAEHGLQKAGRSQKASRLRQRLLKTTLIFCFKKTVLVFMCISIHVVTETHQRTRRSFKKKNQEQPTMRHLDSKPRHGIGVYIFFFLN